MGAGPTDPPNAVREDALLALFWIWSTFGGFGRRVRRGFGALQMLSAEYHDPERREQKFLFRAEDVESLKGELRAGVCEAAKRLKKYDNSLANAEPHQAPPTEWFTDHVFVSSQTFKLTDDSFTQNTPDESPIRTIMNVCDEIHRNNRPQYEQHVGALGHPSSLWITLKRLTTDKLVVIATYHGNNERPEIVEGLLSELQMTCLES